MHAVQLKRLKKAAGVSSKEEALGGLMTTTPAQIALVEFWVHANITCSCAWQACPVVGATGFACQGPAVLTGCPDVAEAGVSLLS